MIEVVVDNTKWCDEEITLKTVRKSMDGHVAGLDFSVCWCMDEAVQQVWIV